MVLDLADERVDVDDGVVAVVGLGARCDFVTPDEYCQRLVRGGWHATVERQSAARDHPAPFVPRSTEEVEKLVEDFKQGLSFDVHEFADLVDGRRLTLRDDLGFTSGGPAPSDQWHHLKLEQLGDVLTTVLPDETTRESNIRGRFSLCSSASRASR